MLEGVSVDIFSKKLKTDVVPVPYFVLATDYYDWYFGLKRLFAEGMRPRYVLLGLSPNQFASYHTRGEYSARYLFRGRDLIEVAQKSHMDATTASSFLLAHVSKFYATRQITRGFILTRLFPGVGELLHKKLGVFRDPAIPEDTLRTLATGRLVELESLCRSNGARFILVVPPTYQSGAEAIEQVGRNLGIPVLIPVKNDETDQGWFQEDGFHLNDVGATEFTNRLATDVERFF
jgi:hypothetical protein